MSVRVTVTLPEDVLVCLDSIADSKGVSRSDVVREASSRYVVEHADEVEIRAREIAVEDGITWLKKVAARPVHDPRPSLEILRELRDPKEALGAPIDPDYDDPGIP